MPIETTRAVIPTLCPICGKPNGCKLAAPDPEPGPCWCQSVVIGEAVLRHVPPEARHRACVCRECVRLYSGRSDPED